MSWENGKMEETEEEGIIFTCFSDYKHYFNL